MLFTWNDMISLHYSEISFFLTLAGIFNILMVRALVDENKGKRKINNMPPKDDPYIDQTGTMIIPFSADPKYHFWNGGQTILKTLLELNAPEGIWSKHTEEPYPCNVALSGDLA
jgi:hypothetical protein